MTTDVNYIYTEDMGCGAALLCLKHELVRIDRTNPRRATFVFTRSDAVEVAVESYWADQLSVGALAYSDAIRRLKSRLYGR